jgi:hypothetical protein
MIRFRYSIVAGVVVFALAVGPGILPASAAPRESEPSIQAIANRLRVHATTIAELTAAAEQAEEIMATIRDVNTLMRPMIPGLRKIAESRALKSLDELPYVGVPAKTVRVSADLLEALARGLIALEELDLRTAQKLRRSIFATDRFLRTESRVDLAELVASYDSAIPVLDETVKANDRAVAQIDAAQRILDRVARMKSLIEPRNAELAKSVDELRTALTELRRAIVSANRGLRSIVAFMQEISRDGHTVLGR